MDILENYKDEYDYLTEILNRRSGEYRIAEQLAKGEGALAVIDLDNFKMVNDTYGHIMGDYVLKQVADILKMHEKEHIVCRMAGDEFLVFVRNATENAAVAVVVENILETFAARCEKDEILAQTSLNL